MGAMDFVLTLVQLKAEGAPWADSCLPPPGTCLAGGGRGGGSRGEAPRPAGTYPIHSEQKNYWRMNNSTHGNAMLSAVNKGIHH